MKRHVINAAYGLVDYASYPLTMLLVAPIILRRLGSSEYGLWIIATAVISTGGIVASGFCDASIRRVASLRSSNDLPAIVHTVRAMLGINLSLGAILAILVWSVSPYAAQRVAVSSSTSSAECLAALRIAGLLILFRAVESVAVGTQRAFERYREPVQIAVMGRLMTLCCAALLAWLGQRTIGLLLSTALFLALSVWMQLWQLRKLFGTSPLWPTADAEEILLLLRSGVFLWVQSLGGIIFGHLDRILLGLSLGASMVTPYVLCIQFSQPVFGIAASSLHFIFPHFSARIKLISPAALRRMVYKALALNLLLVGGTSGALLVFGKHFLRLWAGASLANRASGAFAPIVVSAALTGLSVTGVYTLQAMGRFHTVSIVLLSSRVIMSLLMGFMIHRRGLAGLLIVRLLYGAATLLVYLPLLPALRDGGIKDLSLAPQTAVPTFQGGA